MSSKFFLCLNCSITFPKLENSSAMLLCYFLKFRAISAKINTTEGLPFLRSLKAIPSCNSSFPKHRTDLFSPEAGPLGRGLLFTKESFTNHSTHRCRSNLSVTVTDLIDMIEQTLGVYIFWIFILLTVVILYFCTANTHFLGYVIISLPYT